MNSIFFIPKLKNNFLKIIFSLTCIIVFTGCEIEPDNNKNTFTFGLLPTDAALEMHLSAENLESFLETRMNQKVKVYIPTSYEALIEALRFGHIDAAFFDSGPAVIAHAQLGAEVVLAEVNDGETFYNASLFVRAHEKNINSLEDLLNKKIAFTSWTGSSGFIYPIGSLIKAGLIQPKDNSLPSLQTALNESFELYTFSGGYQQSLNLLLNEKADVIGGSHDMVTKFLEPNDQPKIKKIIELGPVPSHPVVVRKDLDSITRDSFVKAMLDLNEPENNQILSNIYGVQELRIANTKDHLESFDSVIRLLPAIENKIMDKSH